MRESAIFVCFFLALTAAPAAAQQLVYRVDNATAVMDGGYLVIHVKGAAKSGGWEHPRLIVRRNGEALEFQFVATPPQDTAAVVHSVVPLTASVKTRAPHGSMAAVKVVSATNTVTTQIIERRQRTALQ